MPGSKELYDKLYSEQLYTNSYNDFVAKYGSEEGQNELYKKLSEQELYTNDINTFKSKYFSDVKKKDVGVSVSSSGQPIGLSASPRNPSAYNKGIESRDWQAHQALTRSLQEAAQKNDAVAIKNAQSQLEQLRASNPNIASDPLLNEDLQTANKFIKAAPVQPAAKPIAEVALGIKEKAPIPTKQRAQEEQKVTELNKKLAVLGEPTPEELNTSFKLTMLESGLAKETAGFKEESNQYAEDAFSKIEDPDRLISAINNRLKFHLPSTSSRPIDDAITQSILEFQKNKQQATNDEIISRAKDILSEKKLQGSIDKEIDNILTSDTPFTTDLANTLINLVDPGKEIITDPLVSGNQSNMLKDIESMKNKVVLEKARFDKNMEKFDILKSEIADISQEEFNAMPDEDKRSFIAKQQELNLLSKDLYNKFDAWNNSNDNIQDFKQEADLLKRNYGILSNAVGKAEAGALSILGGGSKITGLVLSAITGGNKISGFEGKGIESAEKLRSTLSKPMSYKDVENPYDFFRYSGSLIADQAANFALAANTGGMAPYIIGLSATGQKYKELEKEEQQAGKELYSTGQKLLTSLLIGGLEVITEKAEIKVWKKALPSWRLSEAAKRGATDLELNMMRDEFKKGIKGAISLGKEVGSNQFKEGSAEAFSQIGGNLADKYVLGKKNVGIFDGVEDAFVGGATIGGLITVAPALAAQAIAPFVNDPEKKIKSNSEKLKQLETALADAEDVNKPTIQASIDRLSKENVSLINGGIKIMDGLTPSEIRRSVELYDKIKDVKKQYLNIKNDANLSEEQKKSAIETLNEEYNNAVTERLSLLKKGESNENEKPIEVEVIPNEIASLKDDEIIVRGAPTLEEIPEQFRDRAKKSEGMQVETRKSILGIPYGKTTKETVNDGYSYTLTGKEAKDYAIQEQGSGQVPVQPETGVSQEVEQGKPEAKPQVVAEQGEEVSQEVKDLRAKEQVEYEEAIPNIETFRVNGEIDKNLMTPKEQAKYSDIYNKYDELITPLLAEKPRVQEAKAPSIQEEGTRLPEQKAEGVRGEPTIEEEAKKKSAFDQVEGGVEAKQKSLDTFEKTRKRGQKTFAEARENAISTLKKTFAYERADDVQRNEMERELRTELGEKLKKAPSVNKILGKIKNIVKVTVNEATALKEQIKLEVKAAKDAVKYINELRKNLSSEIAALEKGGKISARQAKTITNRLGKINLQNPVVVNRFVDYMTKVFNDAEYADKIRIANENKNKIKRLYKGNNVQATISTMAKNFLTLNPKKLSDIDQYLSISNQVLQAVMRTQPAVIKDVNKYIEAAAKEQADKIKNDLLLEYQYLVDAGILDDSMSYEDIIEVIDGIEDNATQEAIDKGEDVRQYLVKMFNSLSAIGKEILSEGVDPVTGLPVDLSDDQKLVLKQFLNMDIENMSIQDAKLALEYLSNFITNGITDGMGGLVQSYAGSENFKKFKKTGAKFRDLKLFFSSKIGRAIGENITNLNILLEQALNGQDRSAIFRSLSGFNDIVNGNAKARKIANQKLIQYVEQFKGVKDFFTVENNIERGVLSFLIRTNETKEELERRKGLIEQSIEKMMNGNEKEVAKAKIIQETYDRIGKDAKTVQDVIDAASKDNRDAVDWWINNWSNDYDRLKDLSLNIYNADLGKDQNYTPDVYDKTDEAQEDVDNLRKSAFMMTTKDYTVKKKTGVLMEAVKPAKLNSNRVVSFDFDTNNARAYEAAMVDLETAAPIRRIDGFMNSKEFNKLGKSDDVKLIKRRINGYIGEIRGKNYVSKTSIQEINKTLDAIGSIGAALTLGGVTQPVKQIAPVAFNTLINTGEMLDVKLAFNKDVNNWINELGMPIANRGMESLLTINTANKYLEQASKHKGQKSLDFIKKASEVYLDFFLKKPDVFIARASFISYYKKQLKKKGVDVSNIDWATHKVDKAAAQYAQDMVDRQQNVSDAALMGDLMTSKDPWKQVIRKTTLTFMNFVLNQKARMYSDVITLKSKDSTEEDKKMARRSLAALSVEMSVYSVIGGVFAELIRYASAAIMGEDETEEQKAKRRKSRYELVATNISKDFLSPIPFTDAIVVGALNEALDQYYKITKGDEGDEEGDRFRLFEDRESSIYDNLGAAGISFERLKETINMFTMASTGEFEQEFILGKRTTKYLRDRDKEALAGLGLLSLGTNLGLLPSEIGSMVRSSVKIAKKRALSESKNKTRDLYKSSNAPLPDYLK